MSQESRLLKLKFLIKLLTSRPNLRKTTTFHTEEMLERSLFMSMNRLLNSRNNGNKLFRLLEMNSLLSKVDP